MPNGYDRNWVRLCAAINGFRLRHKRWPTRIRLTPSMLSNLREDIFTPESFKKIEEHVRFILDDAPVVAEDDLGGRYSYGEQGFPKTQPDIDARFWLGVIPDRPAPHWDNITKGDTNQ